MPVPVTESSPIAYGRMLIFGPEPPPPTVPVGALEKRIRAAVDVGPLSVGLRNSSVPCWRRVNDAAVRSTLRADGPTVMEPNPDTEIAPTVSDWTETLLLTASISRRPPRRVMGVVSATRLVVPLVSVSMASVPPARISNADVFKTDPLPLSRRMPVSW